MKEKLKDFIYTSPGFQYSINLKYDLLKQEKISQYIPLASTVNIIKQVLESNIPGSNRRAWLFSGSYGTGKSHLCLVLLAILAKTFDDPQIYSELLRKVRNISPETEELIRFQIGKEGKKMLPVIITGSDKPIEECFTTALQLALQEHNLQNLYPKTNFTAALKQIELWKNKHPDAFLELQQFLKNNEMSLENLISGLSEASKKIYDLFLQAYSYITRGASFQPLLISKVEDVYKSVSDSLPNTYQGITIVFDEFGKYLEQQWEVGQEVDLKPLQDLAELCNSNEDSIIQLVLITHKPIVQYAAKHSQDLVNEWRKIEGRFRHIEITNMPTKTYEILSQVILKDEDIWQVIYSKFKQEFDLLCENIFKTRLFSDISVDDFRKYIIKGAYPLHPLTVFCLPRLSQQLAQNERTIFTFLAAQDKNSLADFLNTTNIYPFKLLSIDFLYNYFESLMMSTETEERIRDIYLKTSGALARLDSNDHYVEARIIKSLAVIKIINLPAVLPATSKFLRLSFLGTDISEQEFSYALQKLLNMKVLFEGVSSGNLEFLEPGEIDVCEELKRYIVKYSAYFEPIDFLNKNFTPPPVLAKRYNDEYTMVRYFTCHYINKKNIIEFAHEQLNIHFDRDGFIYYVLPQSKSDLDEIINNLESQLIQRVIFVLPKYYNEFLIDELNKHLRELDSLQIMLQQLPKAEHSQADRLEILLWINEKEKSVKKILEKLYGTTEIKVIVSNKKQKLEKKIISKNDLTKFVSEICFNSYGESPKFNNEMINKHFITKPIQRARQKIVDSLLKPILQPNLGFTGNGPEVAIYKALLLGTGTIIESDSHVFINDYKNIKDQGVYKALLHLQLSIEKSSSRGISFEEIIKILCLPPLGVRRGVIPILLAVFLHNKKNEIQMVDSKGSEILISGKNIEEAMSAPNDYYLVRENWSEEKNVYCHLIKELFQEYVDDQAVLNTLPRQIIDGIRRWFVSLPKVTRDTQKISKEAKLFRKAIRNVQTLSSKILFYDIPGIFGFEDIDNNNLPIVIEKLQNIKDEMECYHLSVIYDIEQQLLTKVPFSSDRDSIFSALKKWYTRLSLQQKERLYSDITQDVMELIETFKGEDHLEFTRQLLFIICGFRVEDWSDLTPVGIVEEFEQIIQEVESFQKLDQTIVSSIGEIYIEYDDIKGDRIKRTFPKSNISDSGVILKNLLQSYINEYGDAISKNEKRSILISLLEELL